MKRFGAKFCRMLLTKREGAIAVLNCSSAKATGGSTSCLRLEPLLAIYDTLTSSALHSRIDLRWHKHLFL